MVSLATIRILEVRAMDEKELAKEALKKARKNRKKSNWVRNLPKLPKGKVVAHPVENVKSKK